MARGYLEGKFESSPGNETNTPTLSTKEIFVPVNAPSTPALNPTPLDRSDELRGLDEPVQIFPDQYDPTWNVEARAYPDVLGFFLKGILGAPTTTAGNGTITDPDAVPIPTGAYRHVWTAPFLPTGITPQTMQLQWAYTDNSTFFKAKGAAVDTMNITAPDKGGCVMQASGPCLYLNTVSDPGLSATYESLSVRPFTNSNVTLPTWLSNSGTHDQVGLTISNPVDQVHSMGIPSKWPDVIEKGDGILNFTGTLMQRDLSSIDWNALRDNTTFAATVRFVNDTIIASGYPYKLYVAMSACQYIGGDPDGLDNKRHHGANFNFKAVNAGSASVTVTLVNATTSYA